MAASAPATALIVFAIVYAAMAVGHLPGLQVDRTGAALVGALALIATGTIDARGAWNAIDYRTIGLLFGLMIVSSAFVVSGFYAWAAARVATLPVGPRALLAVLIGTSAALSSLLTNDVVVVAMTPLLVVATLSRGLNPVRGNCDTWSANRLWAPALRNRNSFLSCSCLVASEPAASASAPAMAQVSSGQHIPVRREIALELHRAALLPGARPQIDDPVRPGGRWAATEPQEVG